MIFYDFFLVFFMKFYAIYNNISIILFISLSLKITYYDWSSSFSWQQNEIQKYYGNQQVNEQI